MTELIWEGKYDRDGRRVPPLRVPLPFQTVETINESAQDRQRSLDLLRTGRDPAWRNRLIWGDKKYVLPALLDEFAGAIDLIYIDPPFDTGADFSMRVQIDGEGFVKEPSIIEQKAYRDAWGVSPEDRARGVTHLDRYLRWFYETCVLLHELLSSTGSLYVHLDWHVGHYAKTVLDEIFGIDNFRNEIVWHYYNKLQGNVNRFASNHDVIFWYTKTEKF
ncbi:MAG TPA: site-specific DNA-methyltransferase, partial [Chloroflexota bacterium]